MVAAAVLASGPAITYAQGVAPAIAPAAPPLSAPARVPETALLRDKDVEGEPRLSLPTEADRDAWKRGGFRLGLGFVYGRMAGLKGAPSGRLIGATIRLVLRLDADWSVLASFQYALASETGGLSGLRFAGTIDPTWHVTSHLSLAIGLGFGGIVEGSTSRSQISPLPSTLGASYTFPSPGPPLPTCSGIGATALARAEWGFVLGPRAMTALGVEAFGQWTGCVDDPGLVEADTGQSIVRRQWWPHVGIVGTWGIMWR